ncbi:MAG: ABC transporter ATP-binding protein [Hyphomicrobiaceae bacterium]|nr:ABC transporter ATP-binding protein [Hyphomicrobiaceae bacterium]MCC0008805.1 ABC transporter ATP-binding protein [Hyphomicrobiaceae bacterium]
MTKSAPAEVEDSARTSGRAPQPRGRKRAFDQHSRELLARFLQDWVWPRWRSLVVALTLTAFLAMATGAYPIIIKQSFDTLLKGNQEMLPYVLAAIAFITAARSFFLYLHTVTTSRIVQRLTTDLKQHTFAHLMHADFARLSRETPGRLMSRLTNDVSFIEQGLMAAINTAVRDSLSIVVLVGTMIWLDWAMSLIVLGVYPLAAAPIMIITGRLRKVARRTQSELGQMTAELSEKLSGVRLIKTYRLEDYAAKRVNASFEEVFRLRMKAIRTRARLDPMLEAFGGLAVAGVIAFAYWRIASGISTVGDFMGFVTALLMASQPIRAIGNLAGRVQEALAAIESVYGILDEKPKIVDAPGAPPLQVSEGHIRFDDVSFSYGEGATDNAVRNVTLDARGGTTLALVGRSGAGKSTLVNLVPRLFDVTSGAILIDGQRIDQVSLTSLRNAISIVSQDVTLFDDSIRANIALGRLDASEEEIVAAAKAAAAHEFILAQPAGYDTQIGDRGLKLSGGQRQRLALARAILKNAPILLLDEATSALDTHSERMVHEALDRFTEGRTTLVIAHRLSTVQNADMICVMEGGRVVETGKHGELVARGGIYAGLVRSQLLADDSSG